MSVQRTKDVPLMFPLQPGLYRDQLKEAIRFQQDPERKAQFEAIALCRRTAGQALLEMVRRAAKR